MRWRLRAEKIMKKISRKLVCESVKRERGERERKWERERYRGESLAQLNITEETKLFTVKQFLRLAHCTTRIIILCPFATIKTNPKIPQKTSASSFWKTALG